MPLSFLRYGGGGPYSSPAPFLHFIFVSSSSPPRLISPFHAHLILIFQFNSFHYIPIRLSSPSHLQSLPSSSSPPAHFPFIISCPPHHLLASPSTPHFSLIFCSSNPHHIPFTSITPSYLIASPSPPHILPISLFHPHLPSPLPQLPFSIL